MTEAIEQIPALAIEVTSALGETRQVKMTTYMSRDASKAEINELLDKLVLSADRQEARSKIEKLRDDIDDGGRSLQNLNDDVVRLDREHVTTMARIDVQAGYVQGEIARMSKAANDIGRAKPVGSQGAMHANLEKEFEALKTQKANAEAERVQHRGNIGVTIERHEQHLEKLRVKLAACADLAGG